MAKQDKQLDAQIWALVIGEGVLAVLFGIALLFWPSASLALLIFLFGIFVLVWGISNLIRSILAMGKVSTWWIELIFSLLTLGLGVYLLRNPEVTFGAFMILIGFTFIVRGLIDLVVAFFGKDEEVKNARALHVIGGIIGVVAGIIVLSQPVASGVAFVWIVGLYAVLEGVLLITIALRERAILR